MSKLFRALSLAFLLLGCTALFAQEFSAVIADMKESKARTPTKIYVGKNMIRFETEEGSRGGVLLMDIAKGSSIVLMPQQHMYMEMTQGLGVQRSSAFFRPTDVDNACPEWQRASAEYAKKPLVSCHRVGEDTVNGRATVKYEGTSAEGDQGSAWIDRSLRFVIKWQGKNGVMELHDIKEGPQPSSLFEIPSDYQKFDMGAMRSRNPQGPQH
jgi:hypothetical protein